MNAATEVAKTLGCNDVKLWTRQDGWDYPFQVNYHDIWQLALDSVEAARLAIRFLKAVHRALDTLDEEALTAAPSHARRAAPRTERPPHLDDPGRRVGLVTTPAELSVSVVGGGIAGLSSALLLARFGASVTVYERAAHPGVQGAGILVQPNGLAVLDGLGLAAEMTARGQRLTGLQIRNVRGWVIADQPVPDFGDGLDHCVAVLRSDLHRVLLDAVRDTATIDLRLDTEVVAAHPAGRVELARNGKAEVLATDLVIGADGVSSAVRTGGTFDAAVTSRSFSYVRGLVDTEGSDAFFEYWTPLGAFGTAPVTEATTYFYAAAYRGAAATATRRADLGALQQAWRHVLPAAGGVLERVTSFAELIVSEVRTVRCRSWVDGRIVLVGDAAHAMAPNAGQGANSALVDAALLAGEVARPQPLFAALANYQQRRRRKVSRVQSLADRLAWLSGLRASPLVAARDAALSAATKLPGPLDRQLRGVQQEDPHSLRTSVRQLGRH